MKHLRIEHSDHKNAAINVKEFYELPVNYPIAIETNGSLSAGTTKHYYCYIVTRGGVRRAEECELYLFKALITL